MKSCPDCKKQILYTKDSTYKELWYTYNENEKDIDIHCHECTTHVVKTEPPNPHRYMISFGIHKGKRVSELPLSYIQYLKSYDNGDRLLKKIVNTYE